ncbi:MAG: hypothetical protein AAF730_18830 [Bacteroidota bacterium]
MRTPLTSWTPWRATAAVQPVPVSPHTPGAQPLTYLNRTDTASATDLSYKLNAMPPAPEPGTPLGRKVMMLGLFFVFWLVTSAFFMNLYIARYLS